MHQNLHRTPSYWAYHIYWKNTFKPTNLLTYGPEHFGVLIVKAHELDQMSPSGPYLHTLTSQLRGGKGKAKKIEPRQERGRMNKQLELMSVYAHYGEHLMRKHGKTVRTIELNGFLWHWVE